jgi:hypothetical protein
VFLDDAVFGDAQLFYEPRDSADSSNREARMMPAACFQDTLLSLLYL